MLSWDAGGWLFLLVGALPLGWILTRAVRDAEARRARFAAEELRDRMRWQPNDQEAVLRLACLLAAFCLAVVALAGPRWGGRHSSLLPGEVPSLVVVLDVSKSMLAEDMAPNRLSFAKGYLAELIEPLAGWRVGLVSVAGEAGIVCPMTTDHDAVITLAERARPEELKGGSDLQAGLRTARELLAGRPGAVVVLSDGEQLSGDALKAAKSLQAKGAIAYVVGFGTKAGAKIPVGTDIFGAPQYRIHKGQPVISRLDEGVLEAIARETGGVYQLAARQGSAVKLRQAMRSHWGDGGTASQGIPLFQVPLFLAAFILIAEGLSSARPRPAGFSRVLGSILRTVCVLALVAQVAWTWPWEVELIRAEQSYRQGRYEEAVRDLVQAVTRAPQRAELRYDLGCSLYQQGRYAEAATAFREAIKLAPDRGWIHYNLGNALFRQAEMTRSRSLYTEAASSYERALAIDPKDADAAFNLEVVRKRLAEPPQEGGSSGSGGESEQAPGSEKGPSAAEIRATLAALKADERQRQAESVPPESAPMDPGEVLRQMMQQTLQGQPPSLDLPDW